MDTTNLGIYHLSENPEFYEPQRINNFEFIIDPRLDSLTRAGTDETITNAQEIIRLSVVTCPIPHYKQGVIEVARGNTTAKYAGRMTFDAGQITVNDWIGADSKGVLMAWQNKSGNIYNETVGRAKDYKRNCWLVEYTPDYEVVRQWKVMGCWISSLSEDNYDNSGEGMHRISATIEYDKAVVDNSDRI